MTFICFVAGAYSSPIGWWGRVMNIIKMFRFTRKLIKLGVLPITPNVIYCLFANLQPRSFWLGGTQTLLQRCDILFLVPGWEKSEGARAERDVALKQGMHVFTSLDDVNKFLTSVRGHQPNTESVS